MPPLPSRHIQPPVCTGSLFPLWQLFHFITRSHHQHTRTVWSTQSLLDTVSPVKWNPQCYMVTFFGIFFAGASSCMCIGKNRAFQHSDGFCVCKAGYVFYNALDFKSSSADSDLDCQPEVAKLINLSRIQTGCVQWYPFSINRFCSGIFNLGAS